MTRHPVVEADIAEILAAQIDWSRLDGACVLVTGAAGFLPAYMVETILARNERSSCNPTRVVGLVRNLERARTRFAGYAGRQDLDLIEHDVTRAPQKLPDPDLIIHAASQASPRFYRTDPVGTIMANTAGTEHMLRLAVETNASGFLFFSSGDVYGPTPARTPTAEKDYGPLDCLDLRSCYGESKRLGENLCVAFHHQHGVPAKVVRPFHTYGPGMRLDDGRVFADFIADVVQHRPIVLKSDGTATRAFCYLADATAGFFTVLLGGQAGQAYNVGNDAAEYSISQLADLLASLFPERGLSVVRQSRSSDDPYVPSPLTRSCPDISLARSLGWNPQTKPADGFFRTIRTFE